LLSNTRIDLLITDVGLPGGMNGRQLADAARERRRELKVLFITGYAAHALLSPDHLGHGMHVITKPFALDALAKKVSGLIAAA
jgi:CheY-like chemotaxis protein